MHYETINICENIVWLFMKKLFNYVGLQWVGGFWAKLKSRQWIVELHRSTTIVFVSSAKTINIKVILHLIPTWIHTTLTRLTTKMNTNNVHLLVVLSTILIGKFLTFFSIIAMHTIQMCIFSKYRFWLQINVNRCSNSSNLFLWWERKMQILYRDATEYYI